MPVSQEQCYSWHFCTERYSIPDPDPVFCIKSGGRTRFHPIPFLSILVSIFFLLSYSSILPVFYTWEWISFSITGTASYKIRYAFYCSSWYNKKCPEFEKCRHSMPWLQSELRFLHPFLSTSLINKLCRQFWPLVLSLKTSMDPLDMFKANLPNFR